MPDTIESENEARERGREAAEAYVAEWMTRAGAPDPEHLAACWRRLRVAVAKALAAPAPTLPVIDRKVAGQPPHGGQHTWSQAYVDGQREALTGVLEMMKEWEESE